MGFMQLHNRQGDGPEGDIPLTKVKSSASSTGARRPNQALESPVTSMDGDEKQAMFRRRGPAGRRRARQDEPLHRRDSGEARLNLMGRLYNKVVSFSPITRYLVYVFPVAILLAAPIVVLAVTGNTQTIPLNHIIVKNGDTEQRIDGKPLFYLFVWIEVSWLSVWGGKIIAYLLPSVFMFLIGVVSSGTRKYATVLRALEIPVSLLIWAVVSYLVFRVFFPDQRFEWIDVLTKILGALMVSSIVFLVEKAFVQLISISYHQRSFANRIKDSKHEVYLLGLLYDASRALFPMYCPEFAEEDYAINDSIDMRLGIKRGHKKSGSVTPMALIGNVGAGVGRLGDKVTSVFGNIASEITGKQVFNPNSAHSVVVEALEKVRTSEALARRIWMSFVVEGNDSLSQDDIEEVLGPAHREEAEECFIAIDADQNGDISLDEMIRKVVEIGKERKAITHSMKDISQALAVFDKVLLFVVLLLVIFIFLTFFQSSFLTTVATAGTALLSLSFVFAVTTQEFLGSCIFLFVKHPYDVGDRVDIVGPEKEQLIVDKISLLYTVFRRIDKMQVVQVPNIVLNNLWIENVTRSQAQTEVIDVNISFDTSFEDIELLRTEMENFVRHPDNSRDFFPDFSIGVYGMGDLDKLQLKVAMKHKSNWHNDSIRATRRSKFMCALILALKKVPIYPPGGGGEPLGGPFNPTYSVAVSDEVAAASRDKAAANKEALRMVPTKPAEPEAGPGGIENEKRAADALNTRDPAAQAASAWGPTLDDRTLGSRDDSLERKRSHDIETVRQELLSKTQSQRGRRQAGQGLPPNAALGSTPSVRVQRHASKRDNDNGSFDVESQTGGPAGFGANPYGNMTTTVAGGAAAAATTTSPYSAYGAGAGQSSLAPQMSNNSNNGGGGSSSFAGMHGVASAPPPLQTAVSGAGRDITGNSRPPQAGPSSQQPPQFRGQQPF
ncbi:uncharacterized protein E0L32_008817 [Thyridium curvatum]|uniref:Mechanosensitive ion channel protein n=1 Tax=Thyridium curvatum TaxID=1093900 RepID=A0A507B0C0_9PEZI|nr:uncharacterized protein E0L32_008817 [Thyridium curvatum]TPX09970.1 hypothetical protein E0L32_008817 [Thyridium curvatum]